MQKILIACWATFVVFLAAAPSHAQEKKFSIKAAGAEPPKELDPAIQKLLSNDAVQFYEDGALVCEIWLVKDLASEATSEQVKNGLTYRELKESQIVGAIRVSKPWHDYRKQPVKAGVYTLRLGFQPEDGDHLGKSEFKEFLCMSSANRDKKTDLMPAKSLVEMSAKSINTGHPAVLMLFPNGKAGKPALEPRPRDHWVLNVSSVVQAAGSRGTLGFGITLVGEADD